MKWEDVSRAFSWVSYLRFIPLDLEHLRYCIALPTRPKSMNFELAFAVFLIFVFGFITSDRNVIKSQAAQKCDIHVVLGNIP
jgi:hypothetical protein